jgi:RNA polymerase sigma-B factor
VPTATVPSHAASAEQLLREYRATGNRRLRNRVIEEHHWLAVVVAREFRTGGEPLDDLVQVACFGLLKAAERFEPEYGVKFKTFAAVTARGELRRHYRDATWALRVPRRLQELRYEVRGATDVLQARLRRSPTTAEVADYLHVDPDEVLDCLCADRNFRSLSLDATAATTPDRNEPVGRPEVGYADVEASDSFSALCGRCPIASAASLRCVSSTR